jgi:hypothetical protein
MSRRITLGILTKVMKESNSREVFSSVGMMWVNSVNLYIVHKKQPQKQPQRRGKPNYRIKRKRRNRSR